MIAFKSLLVGIFAVSTCLALNVNISGIVMDTNGAPLSGVVVKLVNAGLTATSASDGSFALIGSVGVRGQNTRLKQQASIVALGNGCLRVNIPIASVVELGAYTLEGKALSKTRAAMEAGTHSITLPRLGAGVYLYKLKVSTSAVTIKSTVIDGVSHGTAVSFQGPSTNALSKMAMSAAAFTDAVLATKTGYLSFLRRVTNSDIEGMEMVIKMPVGSGLCVFGLQRQIVMKDIPAGTFTMGSDSAADYYAHPPHQVTLSAFRMQETDVTQEQYLAMMGTNPSYFDTGSDASLRPVEQVSWYDAVKYCNALSLLSGLTPVYDTSTWIADFSKTGYRLPTEAQWEYACRSGSITEYWWGPDTNGVGAHAWDYISGLTTHPVGTKLPNAYGLYDMAGNVEQWCNDWYGDYTAEAATDPTGASTGVARVVRGGSWSDLIPQGLRCAYRCWYGPEYRGGHLGFRCVFSRY